MHTSAPTYKNHRFPPELISHAVWLYCRFRLSCRDVEELLFARGVIVTYEAIRKWCRQLDLQAEVSDGPIATPTPPQRKPSARAAFRLDEIP